MAHAVFRRVLVYRGEPSSEHDAHGYARNQAQKSQWERDRRVQVTLRPLKYEYERDVSGRPGWDAGGHKIVIARRVDEAAIYRQLWTERDPRVPPHRRIDPEGRPTVEDIAAQIRAELEESGPGILAVERKDTADVIGYCGLIFHGNGSPDEPELAYELLRAAHGCGYATEAGRAVVTWVSEAGYRRLWAGVRDWNVASRRRRTRWVEASSFARVVLPTPGSPTVRNRVGRGSTSVTMQSHAEVQQANSMAGVCAHWPGGWWTG